MSSKKNAASSNESTKKLRRERPREEIYFIAEKIKEQITDENSAKGHGTQDYKHVAVGVGGGTLLVLLANNLPDSSNLKSWLVLLAPSTSIAISLLGAWLKNYVNSYLRKKELRSAFARAKETLQESLNDPNISDRHKTILKIELEKLSMVAFQIERDRIIALGQILKIEK